MVLRILTYSYINIYTHESRYGNMMKYVFYPFVSPFMDDFLHICSIPSRWGSLNDGSVGKNVRHIELVVYQPMAPYRMGACGPQ